MAHYEKLETGQRVYIWIKREQPLQDEPAGIHEGELWRGQSFKQPSWRVRLGVDSIACLWLQTLRGNKMTKWFPSLIAFITAGITVLYVPLQSCISAHPAIAAVIGGLYAILAHLLPSPAGSSHA